MDARKLSRLRQDLALFLDDVVGTLGHVRRRRWCETYVRGLLLDGHRKSIEPMAARLRVVEQGTEDYEQALQQFLNQSPWEAQAVRDGLQTWIARQFGTDGALIIDDTGFPKQGTHSVGVARQYPGTLGKIASCQVAVTLQFATEREVVALDAKLYLPQVWAEDRDRWDRFPNTGTGTAADTTVVGARRRSFAERPRLGDQPCRGLSHRDVAARDQREDDEPIRRLAGASGPQVVRWKDTAGRLLAAR